MNTSAKNKTPKWRPETAGRKATSCTHSAHRDGSSPHEMLRYRAVLNGIHLIRAETNERRQMRALRDSECSGSDSQMQRVRIPPPRLRVYESSAWKTHGRGRGSQGGQQNASPLRSSLTSAARYRGTALQASRTAPSTTAQLQSAQRIGRERDSRCLEWHRERYYLIRLACYRVPPGRVRRAVSSIENG
jgi:hypothetical protein